MSEYQYYEFRALDRPLTSQEMGKLRALSSRALITPTSFVNTYHYGDFRGNPEDLVAKVFDAFVYVANWGTHEFFLRLPQQFLTPQRVADFCTGSGLRTRVKAEHIVLQFRAEELEGGWEEGEGWMDSLLPVRGDLLQGDLRALYLGWLLGVQTEELDDDQREPPPPPGLRNLPTHLESLVEFLEIDVNLLEAAAESAAELEAALPSREQLQAVAPAGREASPPTLRTVGELRAAAEKRAEEKQRREAERRRQKQERKEREEAIARASYLDTLSKQVPQSWSLVDTLIATKRSADYDRAAELLKDLRELAERGQQFEEFRLRLRQLRDEHARKPSLLARLRAAGLE